MNLGDKSLVLKLSTCDLLSKYTCFKTRSYIALCLVRNVFRGGCQGVGSSKLNDAIKDAGGNDTNTNEYLIECASKKYQLRLPLLGLTFKL